MFHKVKTIMTQFCYLDIENSSKSLFIFLDIINKFSLIVEKFVNQRIKLFLSMI